MWWSINKPSRRHLRWPRTVVMPPVPDERAADIDPACPRRWHG